MSETKKDLETQLYTARIGMWWWIILTIVLIVTITWRFASIARFIGTDYYLDASGAISMAINVFIMGLMAPASLGLCVYYFRSVRKAEIALARLETRTRAFSRS
jgi:fatty-acid desaturase